MRAKPGSGPQRRSEPHPVDIHVGSRLRQRRTAEKLAATLGITYQQVQKHEHARNRVCASRLYQFGQDAKCARHVLFRGHRGAEAEALEGEPTGMTEALVSIKSPTRVVYSSPELPPNLVHS